MESGHLVANASSSGGIEWFWYFCGCPDELQTSLRLESKVLSQVRGYFEIQLKHTKKEILPPGNIQWGSGIQTGLNFEWLKSGWVANTE